MQDPFWKRPRPLLFSLASMTLLCLLLLILYGLAEKENALLQNARNDLFLSLAIDEAEAAERAWQEQCATPALYHHIVATADYLSMTTQTDETREMTKRLRSMGNYLLHREEAEQATEAVVAYPWQELPAISRDEGKKIAETITQTKNCLHAAAGRSYIYTCQNVYVKLSGKGIPLEIAVYTPTRETHSYTEEDCILRSRRFLENALPHRLCHREATLTTETENGYRMWYPCGTGKMWVDVRDDIGRIVGLRYVSYEVNDD